MLTTATVANPVEGTDAIIIDATAVVLGLYTESTQTTTSVLLEQQLPSRVVLSVWPLPLPRFAPLYNHSLYRSDCWSHRRYDVQRHCHHWYQRSCLLLRHRCLQPQRYSDYRLTITSTYVQLPSPPQSPQLPHS